MKTVQNDIQTRLLSRLEERVDSKRFNLWFRNIELTKLTEDCLEIGVPNLFIAQWMEEHFSAIISDTAQELLSVRPEVKFCVNSQLFTGLRAQQKNDMGSLARKGKEGGRRSEIRRDFQMSNFVVGPCNEFAHAAAMKIVESGHTLFNPLFFYGGVGLGKTHILQAMWHELRKRRRDHRVMYVPAERFTNEYVFALRNKQLDGFRHTYRSADILLIDDVHFLRRKMGFQEEFLHTYNALNASEKQVVMASDAHPKDIGKIKGNLLSRFVSGMIVKLEPPSYETRVRILRLKAARMRKRIAKDVLEFVADTVCSNVRELEGALTTLVAYAGLNKSKITVGLARDVLGGVAERKKKSVDLGAIEKAVLGHFPIARKDLHSNRRTLAISRPRQICMYLARKYTSLSSQEIADFFGKNHTTVLAAEKRIAQGREEAAELRAVLEELERDLVG